MRKNIIISTLIFIILLLSACDYFPIRDAGALMRPPLPADPDTRAIQLLLEDNFGLISFRQPLEGGGAVAFLEKEEDMRLAAAFFGVESGLPPDHGELRIALLRQTEGDWLLLCVASVPGARALSVFAWAELAEGGMAELFYLLPNPNRAGALRYDAAENRLLPMGEVLLNPSAILYGQPVSGENCVLFDADAPEGRFTEIVYWDGKALRAPLDKSETFRVRKLPLRVIESGPQAQIPSEYPMPGSDAVRLVRWSALREDFSLAPLEENRLYLNSTQWIRLPEGLNVTARPDPEDPRTLRFYEWDGQESGRELFWLYSNGSETELRLRNGLTPQGEAAGIDVSFLAEIHRD